MEYRTSVMYARDHPNDEIPVFKTLEEWAKLKSTKLDMAARLCQYLLVRDNLPTPTFEDGAVNSLSIPPVRKGEVVSKDCKIVVFSEFSSMSSLVLNVSKIHSQRS